MSTAVIRSSSQKNKQYQPYIDAKWGLKNHWYPALFSDELKEGEFKAVTICGEPILLRRENGKLYAIEDRCCHRGVRMSKKPFSFKPCTVTCWYHGFTYNLENGRLDTILAAPNDPLIGNASIKVYPVSEKYTMIFVFVGDADYAPVPPLEHDLPPPLEKEYVNYCKNLTEDGALTVGIHRSGESNWRLAVENGFDPGHVLIHWKSPLVYAHNLAVPLGARPITDKAVSIIESDDGPIGIRNNTVADPDGTWHYDLVLENKELGVKAVGGNPMIGLRTSMWLPGVLRVENFPFQGVNLYEFYVPTHEDKYEYWELMTFDPKDEEDKKRILDQYEHYLKKAVFHEFNDDDLWARDAMQPFYQNGVGFEEEKLGEMDAIIIGWRKLVARHARGIQDAPKELNGSSKC
ncbi:Rieske 2Fe-2S domain-containing protein [Herbaspirillum robiniae]|uniref:Rieske 2Fe-2S domain-containing protein n=1 Tax=Herbaspirillum robiniae TaxID=2014887 RepID=UPI003D7731FE